MTPTTWVNRSRSAGRTIQWHEIPTRRVPGMQLKIKTFASAQTKCTVMVGYTPEYGWHLSIAHPFRDPVWDEIAAARYTLVPDDVCMAMMLPPDAEYVNIHEHCFHMHQCFCKREVP